MKANAQAGRLPRVDAFVGQLSEPRGRWICACEPRGHYMFPRNAWTDGAVAVIRARRGGSQPTAGAQP